jgi:hypothetical protein
MQTYFSAGAVCRGCDPRAAGSRMHFRAFIGDEIVLITSFAVVPNFRRRFSPLFSANSIKMRAAGPDLFR